jgi:holo-[acyl-carrier protein] synthase
MTIYGIGTDILDIRRINEIFSKKYYKKFCNRILSINENKEYENIKEVNQKTHYLAKRFAVKEALLKALGTGYRLGIAFNEIEVIRDKLGKPEVKFYGKTLEIVQEILLKDFMSFVSWSDEYPYIVSFAIIQTS